MLDFRKVVFKNSVQAGQVSVSAPITATAEEEPSHSGTDAPM